MGLFDSIFGSDEEQQNTNTVSTQGQASTQSSNDGETDTITEEIPITNLQEAIAFGMRELGKQRRKDGHKIELKVIGHMDFRVGEWCHVFLPTYNEDCFMFISKVNNEAGADSEFITSLTLVDYPPSLGSGKMNSESNNSSDNDSSSSNSTTQTTDQSSEDSNSGLLGGIL